MFGAAARRAARIAKTISRSSLAVPGKSGGFLLRHATGHEPAGKEIDVPLNYADYDFLDALLRLKASQAARGAH